jgi:hypothetical protein
MSFKRTREKQKCKCSNRAGLCGRNNGNLGSNMMASTLEVMEMLREKNEVLGTSDFKE